jgi:hypothetical protein
VTAATVAAARQAFLASSYLLLCAAAADRCHHRRGECRRNRCSYTVGLNNKKPPKMRLKKLVKLIGYKTV